jgi:hypothetical protein
MNCTECNEFKTRSVFQGKSTKDVCTEILGLFDELNVPPSEQLILLNMADTRLGCNSFKNILFALYEKYKPLDEYRAK